MYRISGKLTFYTNLAVLGSGGDLGGSKPIANSVQLASAPSKPSFSPNPQSSTRFASFFMISEFLTPASGPALTTRSHICRAKLVKKGQNRPRVRRLWMLEICLREFVSRHPHPRRVLGRV